MGLSMGISDEIEVATIVIDETIKFGNRERCDDGKGICQKSETFRVFLLLFKPVAFDFLVSFVVLAVAQARL